MRPEVQPERGSEPLCRARSTRWPDPSWKTLAVLFVIVSISPVPKVLPGPVSYFHTPVFTPVLAAALNSSLQVRVKPAGGAGTAAAASVLPDEPAYATAVMPARATVAAAAKAAERILIRRGGCGSC